MKLMKYFKIFSNIALVFSENLVNINSTKRYYDKEKMGKH